ncbi:hypothetical protein EYC84_003213 [Monilinia fructicola]|uniref:Secreted protein n=1 Tax=Monilinia fructicola TaxID=38448 RepID=A0A5M9JTT9_MONFR|nr:hypothetical protein EYC84_003213 [Monilinia fructicola]
MLWMIQLMMWINMGCGRQETVGVLGFKVGCFWRAVEYHSGGTDHFIHRDRRLFLEYMIRLELEAWSIWVRKFGNTD